MGIFECQIRSQRRTYHKAGTGPGAVRASVCHTQDLASKARESERRRAYTGQMSTGPQCRLGSIRLSHKTAFANSNLCVHETKGLTRTALHLQVKSEVWTDNQYNGAAARELGSFSLPSMPFRLSVASSCSCRSRTCTEFACLHSSPCPGYSQVKVPCMRLKAPLAYEQTPLYTVRKTVDWHNLNESITVHARPVPANLEQSTIIRSSAAKW